MEIWCNSSKITVSYSELWHVPAAALKGCAQWRNVAEGRWKRKQILVRERRKGSQTKLTCLRGNGGCWKQSWAVLCELVLGWETRGLGWLEHEALAVPDAAAMALSWDFGSWALHRLPGSIKGISFWYGNFSAAVHIILLATVLMEFSFFFLIFFFFSILFKVIGKIKWSCRFTLCAWRLQCFWKGLIQITLHISGESVVFKYFAALKGKKVWAV